MWTNPQRAQELGKEKKALESTVSGLASITSGLRDARELFDMARAENDDATVNGLPCITLKMPFNCLPPVTRASTPFDTKR